MNQSFVQHAAVFFANRRGPINFWPRLFVGKNSNISMYVQTHKLDKRNTFVIQYDENKD